MKKPIRVYLRMLSKRKFLSNIRKSKNGFWYSTQNDSSGQSFVWIVNKPFKTKIHNKQLEVYSKLVPFLSHLPIFLISKGLSFLFWAFWQLLKWLVGQGWIPFKYNYSSAKFDFLLKRNPICKILDGIMIDVYSI